MSSVSSSTSGKLNFPSQEAIISYLEQHPLTSKETNPYLTEKKIIEAVAKCFANSSKVPMGVQMGVMMTMYDLNAKLKIPEVAVRAINMNLTAALEDCGSGKKFEEKTS